MAKISELPVLGQATGEETVPVVIGGKTFRARIMDLLAGLVAGTGLDRLSGQAPPGYAGGFRDSWGRFFALVDSQGFVLFGKAKITNLVATRLTMGGATIVDGAPAGFAQVWRDPLGRVLAGIRQSGAFMIANLTGVRTINGKPIAEILAPKLASTIRPVLDAEINLFVWYGQSKPAGTESVPVLTVVPIADGLRFVDGVRPFDTASPTRASLVPLNETRNGILGETPASAMDAALKQRFLADYGIAAGDRPYQMLMSVQARGGTNMAGLKVGTAPFADIKADIDAMRSLAQGMGKSSKFRAFALSHGESSYFDNETAAFWRQSATDIRVTLDTYAKAACPANGDVVCLVDQVFAHATYGHANDPYIALEQLAICRDTPGFVMVGSLAHLPNAGYPHWTNKGSQHAGCYYQRAYQRVVVEKGVWKPLAPVDAYRDGRVCMLRFEPESGEIVFDTATVPEQAAKGFSLVKADGAAIEIATVERVGKDTVKITAKVAIPAGAKVRTGHGAGGITNVRDTTGDTIRITIGANTYVMHNWCVISSTTLA